MSKEDKRLDHWDNSLLPDMLNMLVHLKKTKRVISSDGVGWEESSSQLYSTETLAKEFEQDGRSRLNEARITYILAQRARRKRKTPDLDIANQEQEKIPDTEQAFYRGLILGGKHSVKTVLYDEAHIKVRTESRDKSRRDLLRQTIGTRGKVTDGDALTVHLPLSFSFLENPLDGINVKFLNTKGNFAAFVAGLMVSGLSNKENRVTLPNEKIALQLRGKFGMHFPGSRLGRVQHRKDSSSPTLIIDNPSEVWDLLTDTKPVRSLPFFEHLHSPEHKTAATEVEIFPGNS